MPTPREKFQELLKKLFQFDCAELDFGIYRIMNQKRAVINRFMEQNNIKGAKRFFVPGTANVKLDTTARTLTIPFEYRPLNPDEEIRYGSKKKDGKGNGNGETRSGDDDGGKTKKKGQEGILADAVAAIHAAAKKNTDVLAAIAHEKRVDAEGAPVSLLDHHLRFYMRKNTSDFFIHKDLGGFLERELDFYLKNEVLNLDELEAGGESRSAGWFQILRAIKAIARKIIAFVAQIENFQKRLFEKKKFVTEVHYCATLDRVPEELYPEIARNRVQITEWKRMFHIQEIERDTTHPGFKEPVKTEFLKANPFLVLDTKFFPTEFTEKLLASKTILKGATTLDEATEGLLIHGENIHALHLLNARYRGQVDCKLSGVIRR